MWRVVPRGIMSVHQIGDLVYVKHPQNSGGTGWNMETWLFGEKTHNISETGQDVASARVTIDCL